MSTSPFTQPPDRSLLDLIARLNAEDDDAQQHDREEAQRTTKADAATARQIFTTH